MSQNKVTKVTELLDQEVYLNTWSTNWKTDNPLLTMDYIREHFEYNEAKLLEFQRMYGLQRCHHSIECQVGDRNVTFYLGEMTARVTPWGKTLTLIEAIDSSLDRWTFMYRNVVDGEIPWDQPHKIFNDRAVINGRPTDEPVEDGIEF